MMVYYLAVAILTVAARFHTGIAGLAESGPPKVTKNSIHLKGKVAWLPDPCRGPDGFGIAVDISCRS